MLKNSEYIALFPNVMIGLHIDHFYIFWLEPISPNETKEHIEMYYIGEESAYSDNFKEMTGGEKALKAGGQHNTMNQFENAA